MSLNDEILQNNQDLYEVLDTINSLPRKENLDTEVNEQTDLLAQLQEILSGKAAGGGDAFGYIVVKYPAGSNCGVVLNDELNAGSTTSGIMATATNGFYVFPVPCAGDWWVGCWTGDDPLNAPEWDNEVVTINANNPYAYVELAFRYYLFNNGSKVTWQGDASSGSSTSIGTTLKCTRANTTGQYAGVFTAQDINITNYSKMGINVKSKTGSRLSFGLASSDLSTGVCSRSIETTGEIILDISNISGSYKPSISADYLAYEAIYASVEITQVWLE